MTFNRYDMDGNGHLSPTELFDLIACREKLVEAHHESEQRVKLLQWQKLHREPATKARKGVNPFTKEPCVFKAKPASKTVRCLPMKKLKVML